MAGLFYITYWLVACARRQRLRADQLVLVALSIWALFHSLRHVQRTTVLLVFYYSCLPFLLCALPLLFRPKKTWAQLAFLATFLVYCIMLILAVRSGKGDLAAFMSQDIAAHWFPGQEKAAFEFRETRGQSRVQLHDTSAVESLGKFLDGFLMDHETFLDFANAPMLYPLTNRRFPGFFIPSVTWVGDDLQRFQISRLEPLRARGILQAVVLRVNHWGHDAYDGVPAEMRSYRVAEYIYKHFQPLGVVNRHELWVSRELEPARVPQSQVRSLELIIQKDKQAYDLAIPEGAELAQEQDYYLELQYQSPAMGTLNLECSIQAGSEPVSRERAPLCQCE
jgi:hypothetical protein